jgi:hypothetical protein
VDQSPAEQPVASEPISVTPDPPAAPTDTSPDASEEY